MTNPKKAATCFYLFLALLMLKNVLQDTLLIETGAVFLVLIPIIGIAAIAYQVAKERKWAGWFFTVLFPWSAILSFDDIRKAFENNHNLIGVLDLAWLCLFGLGVFFVHAKFLLGVSGSESISMKDRNGPQQRHISSMPNMEGAVSVTSELSKLHDLLKNGALTQEEFDTQKKRLLKTG